MRLINADLGLLRAAGGNSEVEAIEVGTEEAGSSTRSGGEFRNALVGVGRGLLNDINKAFTAGEIELFALGVEEEVVGVAGDGEVGDGFATGGVEHHQTSGLAAADKEAMAGLVEGHGEIGAESFHPPSGCDSAFSAVDDGDLPGVGKVDEDALA